MLQNHGKMTAFICYVIEKKKWLIRDGFHLQKNFAFFSQHLLDL